MKESSRGRSAGSHTESVLLLLLAVASPAVIGFQYLEWFNSNHLYFEISAPIWTLLYSDFYPEIWGITVFPNVLILAARLLFVSSLIIYNRAQLRLGVLAASGVLLTVIEIYICFMMMTVNSVFGIPLGVLMLFPAPDLDLRLFLPVPILLLVGLYLVRKMPKSAVLKIDSEPDNIQTAP